MLNNKKAWLRIVEAFIAIMLISGVLVVLYSRTGEKSKGESIYRFEESILNEIASIPDLREDALNNEESDIRQFASQRIPIGFNFSIRICEIEDVCGLKSYKQEVYARDRIISSTLKKYEPKKLKIFIWEQE